MSHASKELLKVPYKVTITGCLKVNPEGLSEGTAKGMIHYKIIVQDQYHLTCVPPLGQYSACSIGVVKKAPSYAHPTLILRSRVWMKMVKLVLKYQCEYSKKELISEFLAKIKENGINIRVSVSHKPCYPLIAAKDQFGNLQ